MMKKVDHTCANNWSLCDHSCHKSNIKPSKCFKNCCFEDTFKGGQEGLKRVFLEEKEFHG